MRPTRVEERLHPGVSAKSKHKLVRFALKLPFLPEPDTVEHQSNTLKCYPAPRVVKRFLNTSATKATSAAGASWLEMAAPPRPRVVPSEGAVLQQESGQLQLLEVPGRAPLLGALALGPLGGEGVSHLLVDRSGSRRPRSSSQGNFITHIVLMQCSTPQPRGSLCRLEKTIAGYFGANPAFGRFWHKGRKSFWHVVPLSGACGRGRGNHMPKFRRRISKPPPWHRSAKLRDGDLHSTGFRSSCVEPTEYVYVHFWHSLMYIHNYIHSDSFIHT